MLFSQVVLKGRQVVLSAHLFCTFSTSSSYPGFTIRRLTVDDKEKVIDLVNRYYREEPLTVALNLLPTPDSTNKELEEHAAASLKYGVSIAAVDDKKELVGVMLSDIVKRKDPICQNPGDCPDPKFRIILQVLDDLDRKARMWDLLPESCHTVLYMSVGTTRTDWRRRGLVGTFYDESERIAKEIGAGALRMDCTSAFTSILAGRHKYKKICGIRYKDLPIPQPEPPHLEASAWIKEL